MDVSQQLASTDTAGIGDVLCVDLDHSLVATDLVWESLALLIRTRFLLAFCVPIWLLRGRAYLKQRLAETVRVRPELLPYREEVLSYIRSQKAAGRRVALCTAAHSAVALQIAEYLGCFDEVLASDGTRNLKGSSKAALLVERFGKGNFCYIGDSKIDEPVWRQSAAAIIVTSSSTLMARVAKFVSIDRVFQPAKPTIKDILDALRPHHWSKNFLLLVPILLAHHFVVADLIHVMIATFLFSIAASNIYVLNDLLDVQSDRKHPWKKTRPFAAGRLSLGHGLLLFAATMTLFCILGELLIGRNFVLLTLAYCGLSIAYSLRLKRIVLIDVFVLCCFYGMRLLAGASVAAVPLSVWFVAFSTFFFFSLALAKRYSELRHAAELVADGNSGRNYRPEDRELMSTVGIASAFAAVVILSMYVQSHEVTLLYRHPFPLLGLCPLVLYWTIRVWLIAHRGKLRQDPVAFAMQDPISYIVAVVGLCVIGSTLMRL